MNLKSTLRRRRLPIWVSPGRSCRTTSSLPADSNRSRRPRPVTWLIAVALLALSIAGSSAATARRAAPPPAHCGEATGARWHIRHYYFQYNRHGAIEGSRTPASGNHYHVTTGSSHYCRLAHKWMHRLTSAEPDAGSGGHTIAGFFVPRGEGLVYLEDRPPGLVCVASVDETRPADEKGDNQHRGFCVPRSHRGLAFIWAPAMPSAEKNKPR
jgi:hypothetical protein